MVQSCDTITPPAKEPVTVAELKTHLRIMGDDGSHDGLFRRLIRAATAMVEGSIHRSLITRTLRLSLDCWPAGNIHLQQPPVLAITSIEYDDEDGQAATLPESKYVHALGHTQARIAPTAAWPNVWSSGLAPVRITYTAGYGTEPEDVPEDLRAAVMMIVAHLYENTEASAPVQLHEVPMAVSTILDQYRVPVL